jgi:membrane protease YdiL (CAAX protease family)
MNNFVFFFTPIIFESLSFSSILISAALFNRSNKLLVGAALCFVAIIFDNFFTFLPTLIGFHHFNWNFEGKIGSIFWCLFIVYILKWVTPAKVGLNAPTSKGMVLAAMIGITYTVFCLLEWTITKQLPPKDMLNFQTMLFQLTLPGLAEEFFMRGILLAILNHFFTRRWRIANVNWGIGAVLVTLLFIFGHIFTLNQTDHLLAFHFDNLNFDIIFLSVTLIFLREKTGSIWPGVLLHNLANGLPLLIAWLFQSSTSL